MAVISKAKFRDASGQQQDITLSLDDYKAAQEQGLTLPQYLARKYPTDANKYGNTFDQLMASSGMFLVEDRETGLRPPSMADVLSGKVDINMASAITRPDGQDALTPSGRLLFPAALLDMIEHELREDNSAFAAVFNRMVAQTVSVNTPRYDQVVINLSGPRTSRSQPISQLAEPAKMISITLAEVSRRMPVYSIGLEISDEAQRASALDLVGIAVREQALQERADRLLEDLKAMVDGDEDSGQTALSSVTMQSFDSAIDAAGKITQRAWVKYLRSQWRRRTIDWVIADIDTYLAIEGRTGRPTAMDQSANDERLNSLPAIALPGIPDRVNIFPLEDASTLGANTLVGIDSRKAIRKIVYAGAAYQAIEDFVMRRSTAMRFDWSERYERLGYDQAWAKVTLTV